MLNALAYRSGSGSKVVALSFSTVNSESHWDLVPAKDKDLKWFLDSSLPAHDRQMKGFGILVGCSTTSVEEKLLSLVLPRTCADAGQGSKEWFLDRMFSGTSSQINQLITAAAPLLAGDDELDDEAKTALKEIADFIGEPQLFVAPDPEDEPAEEEQQENENEEDKSEEQITAEDWVFMLTDKEDEPPNTPSPSDASFRHQLPTLPNKTLAWMLHILTGADGSLSEGTNLSNKKKLEAWLRHPRDIRNRILFLKSKLLQIAKKKKISIPSSTAKADIVRKINKENQNQANDDTQNKDKDSDNESDNENEASFVPEELMPLVAILKQSFLRPQRKTSERTAAKIGHVNESRFLNDFWEKNINKKLHSPDNLTPPSLSVIYRPGLVCKVGENNFFVKDSADGVAVFDEEVSLGL